MYEFGPGYPKETGTQQPTDHSPNTDFIEVAPAGAITAREHNTEVNDDTPRPPAITATGPIMYVSAFVELWTGEDPVPTPERPKPAPTPVAAETPQPARREEDLQRQFAKEVFIKAQEENKTRPSDVQSTTKPEPTPESHEAQQKPEPKPEEPPEQPEKSKELEKLEPEEADEAPIPEELATQSEAKPETPETTTEPQRIPVAEAPVQPAPEQASEQPARRHFLQPQPQPEATTPTIPPASQPVERPAHAAAETPPPHDTPPPATPPIAETLPPPRPMPPPTPAADTPPQHRPPAGPDSPLSPPGRPRTTRRVFTPDPDQIFRKGEDPVSLKEQDERLRRERFAETLGNLFGAGRGGDAPQKKPNPDLNYPAVSMVGLGPSSSQESAGQRMADSAPRLIAQIVRFLFRVPQSVDVERVVPGEVGGRRVYLVYLAGGGQPITIRARSAETAMRIVRFARAWNG